MIIAAKYFFALVIAIVLYERLNDRLAYLCCFLVQASALLVCILPIPQWRWTIAEMSASVWTSSISVQTFGAIIHPNSEYMAKADQRLRLCNIRKRQRIGQPYVRKQSPDDGTLQSKKIFARTLSQAV